MALIWFLLEMLFVAISVALGAWMAMHVRIIPKSLLHLPQIDFGRDDILTVLSAFLIACAVTSLVHRFFTRGDILTGYRKGAREAYALLTGIVAAALYLFLFTAISFSPELLLDATLIFFLLYSIGFAVFAARRLHVTVRAALGGYLRELIRLLAKPGTWLVLLFALSPVFVAWRFTTDRDFANAVTQLRVSANVIQDHPFVLVNALGTEKFLTPIMMQFAKGDPAHIYVLTRNGALWRADYPSGRNAQELINISGKLGYVEMENGALGFDLHPRFAQAGAQGEGLVYIFYTSYKPDAQTNYLVRYDLRQPQAAPLILIAQNRPNDGYHNAGSVNFGPDGFLYISMGEASMPQCHQRVDCALAGGILRIDVDAQGGSISHPITRQPLNGQTAHYYIPNDNPFVDQPQALGEFWALGLRNPFRISFDSATGALWAGDVGSTMWEEVNRITKGGNYQFPYIEGKSPQSGHQKPATLVGQEHAPILYYKHTAFLRSVIGGTVYRGRSLAGLNGHYIFNDNYSGEIMAIPVNSPPLSTKWRVLARAQDVAQRGVTALVEAPDGALLVSVMGDNDKATGMIARLVPRDSEAARAAEKAAPAPLSANAAKPVRLTTAQARSLFNVNCARCHGVSGKGDGPDSQSLGSFVPDFTSPAFHRWRSDAELLTAIRDGGTAVGRAPMMPPWKDVLKDEELLALRDYVRHFRQPPP